MEIRLLRELQNSRAQKNRRTHPALKGRVSAGERINKGPCFLSRSYE